MKMHTGGQTKNIPFYRSVHAAQKTICPLTHGDVDVHEEGAECFIILRLGIRAEGYAFPEI